MQVDDRPTVGEDRAGRLRHESSSQSPSTSPLVGHDGDLPTAVVVPLETHPAQVPAVLVQRHQHVTAEGPQPGRHPRVAVVGEGGRQPDADVGQHVAVRHVLRPAQDAGAGGPRDTDRGRQCRQQARDVGQRHLETRGDLWRQPHDAPPLRIDDTGDAAGSPVPSGPLVLEVLDDPDRQGGRPAAQPGGQVIGGR